ncbi:MAG TPA: tagaturonate epimerase family protein [Phycisphaerae bacterium]|nr:tagaturonate epimerase family protein [Phycisphaerae bacterium]
MASVPVPSVLGLAASFGFGDRTGLATPGHVAALKKAGKGIKPIFAQQSIREMTRTQRTPEQVMGDALKGMARGEYFGEHGADADHLKVPEDVDRTAAAGFTFFTIDPSDDVDPRTDDYSRGELQEKFAAVREQVTWFDTYRGKRVVLPTGTVIDLNEDAVMRAAVKYGRAINRAVKMAQHIDAVHAKAGKKYEIELSVDETPQPTTLAEHWIIAEQVLQRGMKLVSLAPRYIGDFEKGVDYKGDVAAFTKSLADHVAVMEQLGPYKLSLHSGSDKLSIYETFARTTKGRWHVKTAGTSYLEMLRVIARHDEKLFREVIDFGRAHYDVDKATYHVSATVGGVPAPSDIKESKALERFYLELWEDVKPGKGFTQPGRQILHCTFGSTLTDAHLGAAVRKVLAENAGTFTEVLTEHFAKHLEALNRGM